MTQTWAVRSSIRECSSSRWFNSVFNIPVRFSRIVSFVICKGQMKRDHRARRPLVCRGDGEPIHTQFLGDFREGPAFNGVDGVFLQAGLLGRAEGVAGGVAVLVQ